MTKKIILLIVLTFLCSGFIFAEGNDENLDVYVLRTGTDLSLLKINEYSYFGFYGDTRATVLEITPISDNICKVVIAVPWNRAGSFQNYVIYFQTGDVITLMTGSTVAAGIVGTFEYNKVSFLGIAK